MRVNSRAILPAFLLAALSCTAPTRRAPERVPETPTPQPMVPAQQTVTDPRVELLWDTYGVPHIFAKDEAALMYAFGWAQARSHGDLLLRMYGQARGRAAEYWGEGFVDSDVWVRTNDVPARAEQWLTLQPQHIRAYIDAFVAGINAYAQQHPDSIGAAWKLVLPITSADVLAHQQRVLNFTFLANPSLVTGMLRQWQQMPGSNAWAIAPSRSASRTTMLLANPHLPWGDLFTWYEAQLGTADFNAYGATLVGLPTLAIAFNDSVGWTHTVNTMDGMDLYELKTEGTGYLFDGKVEPFQVRNETLRVRRGDGTMTERPLVVRSSVHGPVVAEREGRMLALRVAGLDAPHLIGQYLDMMRAQNRGQFEAALSRLQLPMFTVMYADRAGNIMHVFNGTVPVRARGDWAYWQGILPGDSSATLWTRTHEYYELPRVVNPESGWLQNANDPPWSTTLPFPLDPARYSATMAPANRMSFRAQRSARMLSEDTRLTFDELIEYKHSTRMEAADHIVQDLIAAARTGGDSTAKAAAAVLERWDRSSDAASRGAVLFTTFFRSMQRQRWATGSPYDVPWSARVPLATPDGLSDPRTAVNILSQAAQSVQATYGAMDVAWGDVYRLRRDAVDLPANGGPGDAGVFRVVDFDPIRGDTTRFAASGGDSYVAAIEFTTPVRARTLLTYGNWSQPGSPHRTDQMPLFAAKQLRTAWLTREDIMAHLKAREAF
jgi:acyl-homoserine-lactone acylase